MVVLAVDWHVLLESHHQWGGFSVEVKKTDKGSDVQETVKHLCNLQISLAEKIRNDSCIDERLWEAVRLLFPEWVGSSSIISQVQITELKSLPDLECTLKDEATLWWIKKPFSPNEPIEKRTGKNDKTTIKVHLTVSNEYQDPHVMEEGYVEDMKVKYSVFKKRARVEDEAMEDTPVTKSVRNSETSSDWILKPEVLETLTESEGIQKQLHDPKLLKILTEIDSSPNRLQSLQKYLESNEHFARFIDTMLQVIGAHKTIMDGANKRIVSCINDILIKNTESLVKLVAETNE